MTRNNLANHLAWLLNNIQLSRPLGPTLPPAHDIFDSSRSSLPESSQPAPSAHASHASSNNNASSSQRAGLSDVDLAVDDELFAEDDRAEESTAARRAAAAAGSSDMARLTTKSTKKPSLVSRQEQLPTPPTTGVGKLQQAYTASLSKNGAPAASAAGKLRTPSSATKRPVPPRRRDPSPGIPEDIDAELEDLTGAADAFDPDVTSSSTYTFASPIALWNPDAAARPNPPASRGKKRKSSEVVGSPPLPPRSPRRHQVKDEDDDEFPDIYDLVDEDLITPAMAKRRNATSSVRASPPKLHLSASDTTVLKQRTVTQTVSTTQTSIQRTASIERTPQRSRFQVLSQGASPSKQSVSQGPVLSRPLKVSSPMKQPSKPRSASPVNDDYMSNGGVFEPSSPSPKQSRKFKRSDVVMDSDDEFPASPDRVVSQPAVIAAAPGTPSALGSKRKRTSPGEATEETTDSAIGTDSVGTPSKRRALPVPQETIILATQPGPTVVDHPEETAGREASEPHDARCGSGSDSGTLIMDLFKQQPHILDVINKTLQEKLAKNTEDYSRSFREKWPAERKAQVKRERGPLKAQEGAVVKARAAHEAYRQLEAKHESLLAQLTISYDADEDTEELEAVINHLNKEIEEREQALKQCLAIAGVKENMFHDLPDPQTLQQSAATSALPAATPRRSAHLSRENTLIPECASQSIPSTQSVLRQMSAHGELRNLSKPPIPTFIDDAPSSRPVGNRSIARVPMFAAPNDDSVEDLIDDDEDVWPQEQVSYANRSRSVPSARVISSKRGKSPAKAKARHHDNFSDYGDDDIDALVAMAEEAEVFEQRQHSAASQNNRRARSVLSEASGNTIPTARVKATTKKLAKPTPKLKIPTELMKHSWSSDVLRAFKDRFRLEGFRHNQLEAVNATLAGQDAFVLMPTGGGKSLCYQLPAVVHSGKTRGVTIVVTPLISLMQDQVDHLTARGIVAKSFNGDMSRSDKQDILESFKKKNPEHYVQLLYVTPEMINKSTAFLNGLTTLYRNKRLARLVIDEAHCVSQWGHDFRPDYKELGQVRRQFPGVPVMALTATATNNVIIDIQHNLDMKNCKIFSQSFNRPNLYYEVRQKEKQPVERIAELINNHYRGQTGIVYTLSRRQTEQISQKLNDFGICSAHYHASMDKNQRIDVQRNWQAGSIKVVVATIAFGMGIDKPDVRFVIHHHLPKSLEGYYQETGRAGRDGLPSACYLFFSHGDIHQLRKFIDDSDGNRAQKERQKEMLNRVVMFCENKRDCRRSQLLHYFGEQFPQDECGKTCDNCRIGGVYETQDRTNYAQAVLQAVMYYTRLTMIQCTDYLRGTKKPDRNEEPQPFHGMAKQLSKHEVNSIITSLFAEHALGEENKIGGGGIAIQYFILGPRAASFLTGGQKLQVIVRTGGDKNAPAKTTKKKTSKKKASDELEVSRPTSTYLSSPVGKARKGKSVASYIDDEALAEVDEDDDLDPRIPRHANGYVNDDFVVADDDEDDDYFDPPVAPVPRQRRQRTLDELPGPTSTAPPLTADGELHEYAVSAFVDEAKILEEEVRNNKGLRRPLFTEAQLQQMAIRWTDSLDKMKRIPNIDLDKVNKFGVRFLPLVNKYQVSYREMMGQQEDALVTIPATAGPSSSRRVPLPPPPDDFIDLVSDDEDDANYEEPGVPSKYFGAADPNDPLQSQLDNWQERFAAISQMDDSEPGRGSGSRSRGGSSFKKRQNYRSGGGGSKGGGSRSYSGVSKRKGGSSTTGGRGGHRRSSAGSTRSGATTSKGASSSTTGKSAGGSRGGSGIGLMPF